MKATGKGEAYRLPEARDRKDCSATPYYIYTRTRAGTQKDREKGRRGKDGSPGKTERNGRETEPNTAPEKKERHERALKTEGQKKKEGQKQKEGRLDKAGRKQDKHEEGGTKPRHAQQTSIILY